MTRDELESCTKAQLLDVARRHSLSGVSRMSKAELIDRLDEIENPPAPNPVGRELSSQQMREFGVRMMRYSVACGFVAAVAQPLMEGLHEGNWTVFWLLSPVYALIGVLAWQVQRLFKVAMDSRALEEAVDASRLEDERVERERRQMRRERARLRLERIKREQAEAAHRAAAVDLARLRDELDDPGSPVTEA